MQFKEYFSGKPLYEYVQAIRKDRWKEICDFMRKGKSPEVLAADGKSWFFTGTNFKDEDVNAVLGIMAKGAYNASASAANVKGFAVKPA
jgi:hypothetical protein